MKNQHSEIILEFENEIIWFRTQLQAGRKPSELVNELHMSGMSTIFMMAVAREATGAGIGDLKSLGQWWNEDGITDAEAFDERAERVFRR